MTVPDEWSPERLNDLETVIGQLWPATEQDARAALVEGLSITANGSRVTPSEMFSAVVGVAEAGRSSLPNAGTIMKQVDDRRRAQHGQPSKRALTAPAVESGPPWTPALWTAVFVVLGGRERFALLSPAVGEALLPYCRLVEDLNLLPEHNIPGPEWDGARVALANERAGAIWRERGGLGAAAALSVLGASDRRGQRRTRRRPSDNGEASGVAA